MIKVPSGYTDVLKYMMDGTFIIDYDKLSTMDDKISRFYLDRIDDLFNAYEEDCHLHLPGLKGNEYKISLIFQSLLHENILVNPREKQINKIVQ